MTSNHWHYSYVGTFSQFPCYDVIIFQSKKVCIKSAHYSVAKALEESSLAIVEKIFFLSGNTKQTNIIKIMNNLDSLQRNLLTLISINILKKVFFINWKKLMLVQPLQTLQKGSELRDLYGKETKAYHETLSACIWFFFLKINSETKSLVIVTYFKIVLRNCKELKIDKKGKNLQEKGIFNHQTKGWTYPSLV